VRRPDSKEGTVGHSLADKALMLLFTKEGRVDEAGSAATSYTRLLSNGCKQRLVMFDDPKAAAIVETRDAEGKLKVGPDGGPLAMRTMTEPVAGEDAQDAVARKLADAVKIAEQQRTKLEEVEQQRVVAIENKNVLFKLSRERDTEVTLNHDRFTVALFKRLDVTTEQALRDQTMFGAFSRAYQAQLQRAQEHTTPSDAGVLTTKGRELNGLETQLASKYPGMTLRLPKSLKAERGTPVNPSKAEVAVKVEYIGRSNNFYLLRREGSNDAIAIPVGNLPLPPEHGVKEGDKLDLKWSFAAGQGELLRNGKSLLPPEKEVSPRPGR
jgi:hypothetical protein